MHEPRNRKRQLAIEIISSLFILLFLYAGFNKLIDYQKFKLQIGQSPLLTGFGDSVPWMVIFTEFVIVAMLIIPRLRLLGFLSALTLMVMFTTYVFSILNFSSFVPCSCGGVLEKLSWDQHLFFNLLFVGLGVAGFCLEAEEARSSDRKAFRWMAVFKVKRALWIAGCCLVAISVVLTLTAASGILREGRNSFLRSLPPHPVFEGRSLDLGYNSYYIAGTADAHVYLGNSTSPLHMVVANATLEDTTHVTIAVNGLENQKFWSLRVLVDSPYFYLYDGAVPRIYAGNVNDWVARRIEHDSIFFLDMRPIGSSSFWIKSIRSNGERSVMGKVTGEKPFYEFNEDILESQVDGVFCVDGTMVAQAELNRLVYLYYYRNEYLVLDTNLNILQRGRTIDTTNRAKIRVDVDPMKNVRQFAGPPLLVNRSFAMFQDLAFVSSNLMSQNDHERVFDHASIMDVYDVGAGRYLLSFYVYHYGREEKMRGFAFSGRKMIVLFDRHVESFELNNQYFRSIDKHSRVKTGL